ncbi:hypothetical protein ZIOFF_034275 [Zingiber officinale]|uniref:Amidohydrolase-related domain-containing protein n=1 Tax=Zingiber officinale TaxID=94328 RepID=A0A8J5GRS0_ZINOF|nr:hypothetical protein ZIOFF_034275 [Zingiber officinale]
MENAANRPILILHNGVIVTMDQSSRVFRDGAVVVAGDRIEAVGPSAQILRDFSHLATVDSVVDLRGRILLPGFVNTHVHTSQQLGRGIADDVDLMTWLHKRIWPYESHMTEEDSYLSTLLCGIELIRSGVTCFAEAGGQHVSGMARAVEELGLRACLAKSSMDTGDGLPANWSACSTDNCIQSQRELYTKHHNTAEGRIRIWFGLRQIMNASDQLLLKTRDAAEELKTGIHMHVAEIPYENQLVMSTRKVEHGTVTYLEKIGLLRSNLLAAHSVWLSDAEIGFFAKADVKVSHCPASAMRMLGFAPIKEMHEAGVCVSLGTDGAPSNNRMSIVDEMYLASLINKGREAYTSGTTNPTVVPAVTVLKMATIDGAKSVLWDNEIGSIEVAKKVKEEDAGAIGVGRCGLDRGRGEEAVYCWKGGTVAFGLETKISTTGADSNTRRKLTPPLIFTNVEAEKGHSRSMGKNSRGGYHPLEVADLIVVNPFSWTMVPLHDCISSLVYCMRTENIDSVMCNGQWIMKDHKILRINEEEIVSLAIQAADALLKRAGISLPERMNYL